MPETLSEVVLILVGSTLIIFILISLIVIALFINQKRKFRHSRQLADIKNTYDKEVLRTKLETQLQTFAGISRELHDNVGTLISMAMVHLQMLRNAERQSVVTQKLDEVHGLLNESMGTLRDLSQSINPENMDKTGLISTIRKEIEKIKRIKLFTIEYSSGGDEFPIDSRHQIIIFRIVQEAFQNIIKHSRATEVRFSIEYSESRLTISIQDNGVGFAENIQYFLDSSGNSGIKNMLIRAGLIEANLNIESVPGRGTTLHLNYKPNQ